MADNIARITELEKFEQATNKDLTQRNRDMQFILSENSVFDMNIKGLRKKCDDMYKYAVPFTEKQTQLLKEVADNKWNTMTRKVANLHDEVFAEVMETEMALARIEAVDLTSVLPTNEIETETYKENKSLLTRLTTFKAALLEKQKTGERPVFADDSESAEELEIGLDEAAGDI